MVDPVRVAERFALDAPVASCEPCGAGNINTTMFVTTTRGSRYVLQRINDHVFVDPHGVMNNVARVADAVSQARPGLVPTLIPARAGGVLVDADGTWRMLSFVHGHTVGRLNGQQAFAAGEAFGRFQAALGGFSEPLAVAIEHFHDIAHQMDRLDAVVGGRPPRLAAAQMLVERVAALRSVEKPVLVPGVIHGDCKVDNLIFEHNRVCAVLDLDTVMRGNRAWDFGDLVRSASAISEDREAPAFDLIQFETMARGFVAGLGDLATRDLVAALPAAPGYMTLMLAVRFLVDFLEGDPYFQIDFPDHNLRRAATQLGLAETMADRLDDMHRIVERL